jgi:hypothetical protein
MAVTASDILEVIKARSDTIPSGLDDFVIESYIDEAKAIMLEYCTLPQNIQEIPDVLKYPWVEIATTLINGSTSSNTVKSVSDGDTSVQYSTDKSAQAKLFDTMSINNIRIMNGFRRIF